MNRGQKDYYKRDYAQAKAEGKPFFPYAVYKDLIVATLVIGIVIALAIWHKVEIGPAVNPATTTFVPRPEWYFFFLFELLKIFEGQNALMPVIMATFVVPNIFMILLIATPFIDRNPERRIEKRPFALFTAFAVIAFLAYMTVLGAESPGGEAAQTLPLSGLDSNPDAAAGAEIFLAAGCTSCHLVKGVGAAGPGPDLTNQGAKADNPLTADTSREFLTNPPAGMIAFTSFTDDEYRQIGTLVGGLGTEFK